MAADDLPVLPAFQAIGIGADLDRSTNGPGIYRVLVLVEPYEAGFGNRCRDCMKAVEGADIWDQTRLLFFEHLPDRLAWNVGVFVCLRIHQAPICQPGIQLCKGFEPRARHEEASAQHANLVLYLPLLPARGRATGNGVNQIMTAHLLKAAVVSPTLPDEDRVHRRLHIVGSIRAQCKIPL